MEVPVIGKDVLSRTIKDFSNTKWWNIPRKEIPWYPRIDYERCIGCGLCFLTCSGRVVYDWDPKENKPIVARPYNCMVGCDTCAKLCPRDAISFPHLSELRKWRDKANAVRLAKEKIEKIFSGDSNIRQ
ncbi:ferredoxin family protein [Desulfurococcaceae archaeon MEX13E-LK6-19]|nr:ferredoxin family protein [Desulfurococcaceae archaeon MEX13E-LK6-19]